MTKTDSEANYLAQMSNVSINSMKASGKVTEQMFFFLIPCFLCGHVIVQHGSMDPELHRLSSSSSSQTFWSSFFLGTGQNPIEAASAPGWTGRLAAAALAEHSMQEGRGVGAAAVLSILKI